MYQSHEMMVQQRAAARWKEWIPLISQQVSKCGPFSCYILILDVNSNIFMFVIVASSSQPYTNHSLQCLCE